MINSDYLFDCSFFPSAASYANQIFYKFDGPDNLPFVFFEGDGIDMGIEGLMQIFLNSIFFINYRFSLIFLQRV